MGVLNFLEEESVCSKLIEVQCVDGSRIWGTVREINTEHKVIVVLGQRTDDDDTHRQDFAIPEHAIAYVTL